MRRKILVVDDDAQSIELVSYNLRAAGFQVILANNAPTAILRAESERPALIVLGLTFPQILGFEACRQLKVHESTRHLPLIIVTSQAAEQDRILGFELGADDYVARPFSVIELILRIRKSIQRMLEKQVDSPAKQKIVIGDLALDPNRHEVTIRNQVVYLTPIEFKLLALLMERSDCALERETLITGIWGQINNSDSRTIDAHIKRLRQKLGVLGAALETIVGFGYRLNEGPIFSSADGSEPAPKIVSVNRNWEAGEKAKKQPRLKNRKRSSSGAPEFLLSGKAA